MVVVVGIVVNIDYIFCRLYFSIFWMDSLGKIENICLRPFTVL